MPRTINKIKTTVAPVVEIPVVEESIEVKPVVEIPVIEVSPIVETTTGFREKTRVKLWYRKLGGGSLRMTIDGQSRIIKPNEKFQAYPESIPAAFKDLIKCLDDQEVQELVVGKNKEYHVKEALFEIKEITKGRWFVINGASKKPLNEQALNHEAAVTLMTSLIA